ncbi:MAG: GTP cyclohydrolase I, partial [Candidatus Aminicenantes bacterium]|nr:GTP cyclohydrolase I [Candidatus Aminicenantes bacterium]
MNKKTDRKKIEKGVELILEGIGEDKDDARLKLTPKRAADMFIEILEGTHRDPSEFLNVLSEE